MMTPAVALSINAARPDVPFLDATVRHLVRMCRFPFVERVLVVDTSPPDRRYERQGALASLEELRSACATLREADVVDRVVDVDYAPARVREITTKHFGRPLRHTHDFRGYPTYGLLFAYERARGDYFLHFDSDMLMHQAPGFSWIEEGIRLLRARPQIVTVTPLAGPPTPDGSLRQRVPYERDPDGFYVFQHFTSRKFLVERRRFDAFLPLASRAVSWRRRLAGLLTGKSALERWEALVSERMIVTGTTRADVAAPSAWTLHPRDHGPAFVAALPSIIARIEAGEFPPAQAGDYDLRLALWT
jgi:hypothetical protein